MLHTVEKNDANGGLLSYTAILMKSKSRYKGPESLVIVECNWTCFCVSNF